MVVQRPARQPAFLVLLAQQRFFPVRLFRQPAFLPQHERFKRELLKAIDAGIQIVILVEHGPDIKTLEDVYFWKNPRKHEVRWRWVNGKREKYIVSSKAVDGNQLYKSLCTIRDRYNVQFEFCEKKDTGDEIIRILSGEHYDQ